MTARVDPAHYTYRVTWSPEDNEFVATCLEFPSLSWLAGTPQDALDGLRKVVDDVVDDMYSEGEDVPVPLADRQFSGSFRVRVPESLHRRLATEAAEEGVSMNRLISDRLARA